MNKAFYRITENSKGQFHLALVAPNNETIGSSQGEKYKSHSAALNGASSCMTHCKDISNFHVLSSTRNEPYFELKALNNEIILVSEMYSTDQMMHKGVVAVMTHGQTDVVKTYYYDPEVKIQLEGKREKPQRVFLSELDVFFSDETEGKNFPYGVANAYNDTVKKLHNLTELKKEINECHHKYGNEVLFIVSFDLGYIRFAPKVISEEQQNRHQDLISDFPSD